MVSHKFTRNEECQLTTLQTKVERAYTRDVRMEQKDGAWILGLFNKHSEVFAMFSLEESEVQFLLFSSP